MWTRIKRWWAVEGAMVGLQGVSDRMLADMGLEREGLRERVAAVPVDDATSARETQPCAPCEALRC